MQTFLRCQPRIESFLNKDAFISLDLRSNQLNILIQEYYDMEMPVGLIRIIIEYENKERVIHHQYQQYVAPQLLHDHYPRSLLTTYRMLNYTSSAIAITASFYHLYRWLNQAASPNSDSFPSTATLTALTPSSPPSTQESSAEKLPKFLTLYPTPGPLSILNQIAPNLFSTQHSSLYPSLYLTVPVFAMWTGLEFIKNMVFFNTNRNIQKLSYFMPVDAQTKSITDSLFNEWNEFFYSDNFGLSPKRFILSYSNHMKDGAPSPLQTGRDQADEYYDRLVRVDEMDGGPSAIHFNDERYSNQNHNEHPAYSQQRRSSAVRDNIIVPNPKYTHRSNKLPLPTYKHFLIQHNTLFAMIMLHSTLLPISRGLLRYNHLFLPNAKQSSSSSHSQQLLNLQAITSHKGESLQSATAKLMKLSNILLSHSYCLLHVVSTSIVPVVCLRSVIFGNLSTQLQNVLNPMHLNNNANAANAALARQFNDNDTDTEDDDDKDEHEYSPDIATNHRNVFEEYIDRWSLSNHLTSTSLMLSMIPYVNNFYAMISVFSFGMTLGEGEDIMRWSSYRLAQNNMDNHKTTNRINRIWHTYYIPWIAGVIGITCSFTIEVWASSRNFVMANRFKKISLFCLMLSVCMSCGNRSYLESGFYLRYKNGRNLFEKMTQFAVEIELGLKHWMIGLQRKNKRRQAVLTAV